MGEEQKGGSTEFLEDMLQESGMAGWVQQLGLRGQEQFAGCSLYEESDPVLNLHYNVGNAEAENASTKAAAAVLASRIRHRSPDEAGPNRRRARHLTFGADSQTEDDMEGQVGGEGGSTAASPAQPRSSTRTRVSAVESPVDRRESGAVRSERVRVKREEEKELLEHKALAALTAAAESRAEERDAEAHASPPHTHVPSTPSHASSGPRRDKGLRSFSLKVCQKVEERDVTTYNQVADELVAEFQLDESMTFDEKNIRRRIYDALNVLMAMDIITKDKKHIKWKGFPQSWEKERDTLQRRVDDAARQVARKRKEVERKALQYIALCNIIRRNARLDTHPPSHPQPGAGAGAGGEAAGEVRAGGGEGAGCERRRIRIPFVIVKTSPDNEINLELAADQQEALLNCNASFELHDDVAILEHMRMAQADSEPHLRALLRSCPDVAALLLQRVPSVVRAPR